MSTHKADALRDLAVENEWKAEVEPKFDLFDTSGDINDIVWHLYGKRGHETLHVIWRGDRMESGLYTFGEFKRKLWWRTEVVKFIEASPREGKIEWEEDAPAFEILKACLQKKITWVRKFDQEVCEARVDVNLKEPASAKHYKVRSTSTGRRLLEWVDSYGFHAVGLDQIINVQ